ncbi:MAG: 4Fe-4S binding protein [bacterium]|nr:4Fe-4S binding protein [bacterium]
MDAENQTIETKPTGKKKKYSITLNYDWCKACGICIAFCPTKVYDTENLTGKPIIARPADCIGCMLCELRCPDFAIEVDEIK